MMIQPEWEEKRLILLSKFKLFKPPSTLMISYFLRKYNIFGPLRTWIYCFRYQHISPSTFLREFQNKTTFAMCKWYTARLFIMAQKHLSSSTENQNKWNIRAELISAARWSLHRQVEYYISYCAGDFAYLVHQKFNYLYHIPKYVRKIRYKLQ